MPETSPVARSPISAGGPTSMRAGWELQLPQTQSPLRLTDQSPLGKVLIRASPAGRVAVRLGVEPGRAARDEHRTLVIGSGPGEWLLLGAMGAAKEVAGRVDTSDDDLVSVVDLTHGRALMRLSGAAAGRTLSKVCAIDVSEQATLNGAAFRSSVAKLTTDVVRDDEGDSPSYLLHCERSSGQYLFDAVLDAGREFGIGTGNLSAG